MSRPWCRWHTIILDDAVQHIDDYRALHLVEVLAALRQGERQVICAVEDASMADLLARRLRSTFDSPGRRFDLGLTEEGNAGIVRRIEVPPMAASVLRYASEITAAE